MENSCESAAAAHECEYTDRVAEGICGTSVIIMGITEADFSINHSEIKTEQHRSFGAKSVVSELTCFCLEYSMF